MNLLANKQKIKGKRALPKPKLSIKNTFKLLWIYLRSFKNWLWAELFVSFFVVLIGVGNYFAMQYAIMALSQNETQLVLTIGGIAIGLFFLLWVCNYFQFIILVHVGQNVGQRIRNDVFSKIQKLPIRYFDTHNSGDLMSRFTNDVNAITTALAENTTDVIGTIFWTLGMGTAMFVMSPYLTLITIALVPLFMIVIIVLVKKSQPIFVKQQKTIGALNGFLEEYLSGQNIIDLYSQTDLATDKYKKCIEDIQEVSYKAQLYSGLLIPWGSFMTGFISLFIAVLGIIFIVSDAGLGGLTIELKLPNLDTSAGSSGLLNPNWESQFATLTIYLVLLKYFVQPFSQISNVLNIFQAAIAGANRAFEVFKEYEEVNLLEKIVINIASSNLPIEQQKIILKNKLDIYAKTLKSLEAKLITYPKSIKKEDIKYINNWIQNIKSLKKTYLKNQWTLNIFKQNSDIAPEFYLHLIWLHNQLDDIKIELDNNNFEQAQEIYENAFNYFGKKQNLFVESCLSVDKQIAYTIIDDIHKRIDEYLNNQLIDKNAQITKHNVECWKKIKHAVLELEHEKIKFTHYVLSHFSYEQRIEIIEKSKLNLEDKDDLISMQSFMIIADKFIHMLLTIKEYYQHELKQYHGQLKANQEFDQIQENNKMKLKLMYDDTLADYRITLNSLAMFDSKTIHDIHANIKFNDLTFSYDGVDNVLKDINLDVKAGQTIAIVGPTGSGKSTIINLLTKFYDIEQGDINFEDYSIREITKESLRRNISIVLQDTYLFSESVKENIRFGNLEATDDMIVQAAKLANCHEFIMALPHGYDTIIENNGEGLSQGQRQLLAIARAILSPSSVLILDEATSSIDTKTEKDIQEAMERLMVNKTTFMIAHRLSTVQNATKIVVLKDGKIIEVGNHNELLQIPNGFYAKLYNSQFGDDLDLELN